MTKNKVQKQNYRNFTSRIAGYVSNLKRPRLFVRFLIGTFAKIYRISIEDYQVPENGFKSFNAFFTRKLKKMRLIESGLISPVDGYIFDYGKINPNNKILVKHKHYYVDDLIWEECPNYKSYAVLYLSPKDYHRVHAGFDMEITSASYLPGTLLPVRPKTVYKKNRVYCRNERIVIKGKSEYGNFYCVLIGALMVGKIKLSFDSGLQTNIRKGIYSKRNYDFPIIISKGEELGYFEMGSSVIIVLESDILQNLNKEINQPIRFGEALV